MMSFPLTVMARARIYTRTDNITFVMMMSFTSRDITEIVHGCKGHK